MCNYLTTSVLEANTTSVFRARRYLPNGFHDVENQTTTTSEFIAFYLRLLGRFSI